MDARLYCEILQRTFPSYKKCFHYRILIAKIMTLSTPRVAQTFYASAGINWWRTPESPDMNPIENLWHEVKECMRQKKLV